MDPNFLLKDELEFELACRDVTVKSSVPVMKKILKELMLSDTSGASGSGNKPVVGVSDKLDNELETCATKLTILSNYMSEIVGKPDRHLFKRLVSRLYYVINRLSLVSSGTEVENACQAELTQKAYSLIGKLEEQDDLSESEDLTEEDKRVLNETLGNLGQQIIGKFESNRRESSKGVEVKEQVKNPPVSGNIDIGVGKLGKSGGTRDGLVRTSTFEEEFVTRKLVPIAKWGIKFSGNNKSSVNAFIERVNELKEARNATDADLWRCAIDLFEGGALIWYRANKEYAGCWEDLVILLKRTFQPPYYQEELLTEIKARTQGKDESVVIYISIMQNMFNRLPTKITEKEKIMIILRNLQPYYQRAVCRDDFSSLMDLFNVLRVIERAKINCDNFKEPQAPKNLLEPDLAYKVEVAPKVAEVSELVSLSKTKVDPGPQRRCWNCREGGHLFRDCTTPRQRLFCYRCGRFGLTSKDCKCIKGNASGEVSNPAQ